MPVESGTHSADLSCSARISASRPQSPREAANSASSVISRTSSGSPVRMTIAGPWGASGGSGGNALGSATRRSKLPVLAFEVDRAPARERRDEQLRDAFERLLAGQAGAQDRAHACQQRELGRGLLLSD